MRYPAALLFPLCLAATAVLAESPAQPADTGLAPRVSVPLETAIPGPLYVAVQNDDRIEVLPSGDTWPGTAQAHYNALAPDGRQLLVSGFQTGNVYLVDTRSGEVSATFEIGSLIQGVKISPDGRYGVAMAAQRGVMVVIVLASQEIVKEIEVGQGPHGVRGSADGHYLYTAVAEEDALVVIDVQALAVVRREPAGAFPFWIALPRNR